MSGALQGLRILNTRPLEQSEETTKQIREAQGQVVDFPILEIQPQGEDWLKDCPNLNHIDFGIFISVNAVNHGLKPLYAQGRTWPTHLPAIAIGQATQRALQAQGVKTILCPQEPHSEALLQLPELQTLHKKRIVMFKGIGGRPLLEKVLRSRGAELVILNVYQRQLPKIDPLRLNSLWQNDEVDIILITSIEAMYNLLSLFTGQARAWLLAKPFLVISSRIADYASQQGIQTILVSRPEQMITTLHEYKQGLRHGHKRTRRTSC